MQAYTHAVPDTMVRAEERLTQLLWTKRTQIGNSGYSTNREDVWIQYERPETQVTHSTPRHGVTLSPM